MTFFPAIPSLNIRAHWVGTRSTASPFLTRFRTRWNASLPVGWRFTAQICILLLWASIYAQESATNNLNVRFLAVDIFVDSKEKPLAAYQLEFSVINSNAKIVGIEGGEHAAFREAPYYDPKAMQQERVIIAAFSTEPVTKLPSGNRRVATIHIQTSGQTNDARFQVRLHTAADVGGRIITAKTNIEQKENR